MGTKERGHGILVKDTCLLERTIQANSAGNGTTRARAVRPRLSRPSRRDTRDAGGRRAAVLSGIRARVGVAGQLARVGTGLERYVMS